jgi:hypothetical protein
MPDLNGAQLEVFGDLLIVLCHGEQSVSDFRMVDRPRQALRSGSLVAVVVDFSHAACNCGSWVKVPGRWPRANPPGPRAWLRDEITASPPLPSHSNGTPIVTAETVHYASCMPYRRADADYLREKARMLRRAAAMLNSDLSDRIRQIAKELDARADEIDARPDPRHQS